MKKKSNLLTIVAVLLLIAIIVASVVAGTYARYRTTVDAEATATAATWSFTAGLGAGVTTTIELADTLEDKATNFPNLATGKIAPGTYGTIPITVNGNGSEVGVKYTVTIETANATPLPTGLTFEAAGAHATVESCETIGGVTTVVGIIPLADVGTAVEFNLDWEWTLGEAGDANEDVDDPTGANNDDAGDSYTIDVTIVGEQFIGATSVEP